MSRVARALGKRGWGGGMGRGLCTVARTHVCNSIFIKQVDCDNTHTHTNARTHAPTCAAHGTPYADITLECTAVRESSE